MNIRERVDTWRTVLAGKVAPRELSAQEKLEFQIGPVVHFYVDQKTFEDGISERVNQAMDIALNEVVTNLVENFLYNSELGQVWLRDLREQVGSIMERFPAARNQGDIFEVVSRSIVEHFQRTVSAARSSGGN